MQMYKVFFKESCFLLSDDSNLMKNNPAIWIHQDRTTTQKQVLQLLKQDSIFHATFYHQDLKLLFSDFKSIFTVVGAAGGAVIRDTRILIIKRDGIFDLPKGHIEKGEGTEACALREVEEECGATGMTVNRPLSDTWHIYDRDNIWHLKQTHWFTMNCPEPQQLKPQTEEHIEEVFWADIHSLDKIRSNTYASLQAVFDEITTHA